MNEYGISHSVINQLYTLLSNIQKLLKQHNITYWADGGTILGAFRHKGIIPWDDDVDITIFNTKDNLKILNSKAFKAQLRKINYGITKVFYGYKIFILDGTPIKKNLWREHKQKFKKTHPEVKGRALISQEASKTYKKTKKPKYEKYKYPFIDIFLAKEVDDKIIYPKNHWNKCFYFTKDFYPLQKYPFGKTTIIGPKNPSNYFTKCYGRDWETHGLISYDHKTEKMIKPRKFKLTKKLRKCA